MSKIYVFGNSHVCMFSQSRINVDFGCREVSPDGRFISRCLGPTIAYNFFEHHYKPLLKFLESEKEFDKNRDYVLLVVGEVDCRLHLVNQIRIQKHRGKETIIDECVDRFFRCHLDLKKRGYRVIGWGGHPASVSEGEWTIGPYPKRLFIARYFEQRMRQRCEKNGILFKTIFDSVITPDGLPDESKYVDYCHLNHVVLSEVVEREFKDILALNKRCES